MNWFRVDADLPNHPKLLRFAHVLHIDRMKALGYLVQFFSNVARYEEYGSLNSLSNADIAHWIGGKNASNVVAALIECGFIDGSTRDVHGWKERHKSMLDKRDRERDRREKSSAACDMRGGENDAPTRATGPGPTDPTNPTNRTTSPDAPTTPPTTATSSTPELRSVSTPTATGSDRVGASATPSAPPPTLDHFPAGFFETPSLAMAAEKKIHEALGPGLKAYEPQVIAEIVRISTANADGKPCKYASGMLKKPVRLLEIAARCQSVAADAHEAASKAARGGAGPPRGGGVSSFGDVLETLALGAPS